MFGRVRDALTEAAGRFDPALVDAATVNQVLADAVAIKNMAAAVEALAAARIAETAIWRTDGDRTPAHQLARRAGVSVGQAMESIETGRRLRGLAATSAAARRGELSGAQTAAIADAAIVDPSAEAQLLDRAESASLRELRDDCARTKANVTDLEARRRRIHANRRVRNWVDRDGAGHLQLTDNPERIAAIKGRIDAVRDELFEAARGSRRGADGGCESLAAHAADALHRIVCGVDHRVDRKEMRRPPTVKILVRADLGAVPRGFPVGDEVCEIAGYGPVAVSAVRELLETGDPFLGAIVTRGQAVVGVAHLGRRANAHQQSALEWLYPTCAVEGCNALTFLENDHRHDWARTGVTAFDLLDRLCSHHHRLKTSEGWALVPGRGKRAFVAAHDPTHPEHAHGPPAAA
jgi:hypothetical protein